MSRILTVRSRTQPGGLKALASAENRYRAAERALHEEMFRSHRAGSSLRTIAMETDISHETVRVIVERVAAWVEREQKILADPARPYTVDAQMRSERSFARRQKHLEWLLSVKDSDE